MKYLTFVLLFSCSSLMDEYHFEITPQAKPFVDKFYSYHNALPKNLIVQFTPLLMTDKVLGKTFYGNINTIKLDTSLLTSMKYDPLFFETVLYHEIGHAVLNREHCFNCYSLMNPNKYVQDYRTDDKKRVILIEELTKP